MPNTNRESESNYYFQEKKYKYPQIIYEKPIALTETKKKILINPNYNLEMTIPEISTSDKIIELSQRNKIKSMYENQNNISSSNSRGFLNQFKKVFF